MKSHPAVAQLRTVLEMIKFEHTLFALPFAFLGMLLAAGGWPEWRIVGWIVVAMVGARSAAMGFNRLADRRLDAENPRTADRALPAGRVSSRFVALFVLVSSALLVLAAWRLNPLALALSPVALAVILGYSYTKRFTAWSHLVLGLTKASKVSFRTHCRVARALSCPRCARHWRRRIGPRHRSNPAKIPPSRDDKARGAPGQPGLAYSQARFRKTSMEVPLRVAVVGVGFMGALHALKYKELADIELVAVIDHHQARAHEIGEQMECPWFQSLDDFFAAGLPIDAASVATSNATHRDVAERLMRRGVHCLVEKPLAMSAPEALALVQLAEETGLVLLPGHSERFNPGVRAVVRDEPDIRYIKAYRVGPLSFRSLDTDVILDVMLHDIDLAMYLSGCKPTEVELVRAVSSPEGHLDIANVHMKLGAHCYADLTASRLAIARRRKLRMFTSDTYYSIDCGRNRAVRMRRDSYYAGLNRLRQYQAMGRSVRADDIFKAVGAEILAGPGMPDRSDALDAELQYFVTRIGGAAGGPEILVARDGVRVLEVAAEIEEALRREDRFVPEASFRRA